jgi:glutamate:Na+ symporter, ESS family
MNTGWDFVVDFLMLAVFVGVASILKKRFKLLQKFLIPIPIIAGFIGLFLGNELIGLIPLDKVRLSYIVYHLMAIGFIALSLQKREIKKNREILHSGILIVSTYLIQGILGFSITLILIQTIFPDLFPMFGLLLPLSFGQGPGQAFSIGSQWEELGFINGGNIGLTFATFGFIWASLAGLPFLNYLVKKGNFKIDSDKHRPYKIISQKIEYRESTTNESLDSITIQLFLIAFIYLITFLTLKGFTIVMTPLGTFGQTLSQLLWGFHFIIGSLYGILVRFIINYTQSLNKEPYFTTDNFLLQRITGGTFDLMITASIAAISIFTLKQFAIPILIITTAGGLLTMFYINFMCRRIYNKNQLENILGFYGMMTGTISTGMALLKEVDPNLNTSATDNLVMGSAVGIFFGLPLMVMLSIPVIGYTTNQPIYYYYSLLAFIIYLTLLYFILFRKGSKS